MLEGQPGRTIGTMVTYRNPLWRKLLAFTGATLQLYTVEK